MRNRHPNRRADWRVPAGLMLLGSALVWPGLASAQEHGRSASCSISPQNPTVDLGGDVHWSASLSNISSRRAEYGWSFVEGNPSSSDGADPTITYDKAGTWDVRLQVSDHRRQATCMTRVIVRAVTDIEPPSVSISATPPGPIYTSAQTVSIDASASDNTGVTRVDFYDNGSLQATDTTAPYGYDWTFSAAANGDHTLLARAYDAANNVGTSNTLSLTVSIGGGGGPGPAPDVSINSTSQNCGPTGSVSCPNPAASVVEQTAPGLANSLSPTTGPGGPSGRTDYQIVAVNDLGMHCGDLDTRFASILPLFNVINTQVIRKGSQPRLLDDTQVDVYYSAASNPADPVLNKTTPPELQAPVGSVFKTNYWDMAREAYDSFYPPGVLAQFYPAPAVLDILDLSLPVPDLELLYLAGKDGHPQGTVLLDQQAMPAMTELLTNTSPPNVPVSAVSDPYFSNVPQQIKLHVDTLPFFSTLPFGYTADVNWFSAEGVPIAPFDDFGRYNSYPLMRVHASAASGNTLGLAAGTKLATVDTVVPVSGEADCKNCHVSVLDTNPPADINSAVASNVYTKLTNNGFAPVESDADPEYGNVPPGVSVEWAVDQNLLALHDINEGAQYTDANGTPAVCDPATNGWGDANCLVNQPPIVCQRCHYTPALDLLQEGPKGPGDADANGRQQTLNQSMSRVMHDFHGRLGADGTGTGTAGNLLFPYMPAPDQARDTAAILEQTCYQCHPGKNTKCLRGAMANGGVVCQDCHGQMTQVGNDFSKDVSPSSPDQFALAFDFYTNPDTPRVPWANEPGCGSCHTGDASDNLAGDADVIPADPSDLTNPRLIQAYRMGAECNAATDPADCPKVTPIVSLNKRFSEDVIDPDANVPPGTNPKLYRVSTGHGDLFCESCHGATHAEWPVTPDSGPFIANDNQTALQLQGHTGTIVECSTCHGAGWQPSSSNALGGPHGMHVVGDTSFSNGGHEGIASSGCYDCHGGNSPSSSQGTVLSRAWADRTLRAEGSTVSVSKGDPVGCALCHGGGGGGD